MNYHNKLIFWEGPVFVGLGISQIQCIRDSQKIAAGSAEIPKTAEDSDALNHNSYIADCPIIVPKDVDFYDLLCQLCLYEDG